MAAGTATPFGAATVVNGSLQMVSNTGNADAADDFGGVTLAGTGVTTFASITTLATEFNVTDDDCKSGSPRFSIKVTTPSGPENVFVYLGPSPNFTGCTPNTWLSSGNLISSPDPRFDISQIVAGGQYSTYAAALAAVGTYPVESISLVVDSGWAFDDKEQTVLARNITVNSDVFYVYPAPTTGGMNPAKACAALRTQMGAEAFKLKYLEGLSQEEVAARLNCPLFSAKNHIYYGKLRFKELLLAAIKDYCATAEEYEDELRRLAPYLGSAAS